VRAVGSDIQAGEAVLRRGDRLGAAEVGLLACVGATQLQVRSQLPRAQARLMSAFGTLAMPLYCYMRALVLWVPSSAHSARGTMG